MMPHEAAVLPDARRTPQGEPQAGPRLHGNLDIAGLRRPHPADLGVAVEQGDGTHPEHLARVRQRRPQGPRARVAAAQLGQPSGLQAGAFRVGAGPGARLRGERHQDRDGEEDEQIGQLVAIGHREASVGRGEEEVRAHESAHGADEGGRPAAHGGGDDDGEQVEQQRRV